MFQSPPWPQVYKSKHLGMKTVSGNICERMGRSQELSEFQCGAMIGCHLCNESSHEISSLLNIPQSTVTKWRGLEMTATQPRRGRSQKIMELGQWMWRHIVCRGCQRVNRYQCRGSYFTNVVCKTTCSSAWFEQTTFLPLEKCSL